MCDCLRRALRCSPVVRRRWTTTGLRHHLPELDHGRSPTSRGWHRGALEHRWHICTGTCDHVRLLRSSRVPTSHVSVGPSAHYKAAVRGRYQGAHPMPRGSKADAGPVSLGRRRRGSSGALAGGGFRRARRVAGAQAQAQGRVRIPQVKAPHFIRGRACENHGRSAGTPPSHGQQRADGSLAGGGTPRGSAHGEPQVPEEAVAPSCARREPAGRRGGVRSQAAREAKVGVHAQVPGDALPGRRAQVHAPNAAPGVRHDKERLPRHGEFQGAQREQCVL